MEFKFSQEPPTNKEIQAFERLIGNDLPEDYRMFISRTNGGRPRENGFAVKWKDAAWQAKASNLGVNMLFPLGEKYRGNLAWYFNNVRDEIPSNTIPIGIDYGGNYIILCITSDRKGSVFAVIHDAEEGEFLDLKNCGFVADSFASFIDKLKSVIR